MANPIVREVMVCSTEKVTPNMHRVTLTGESLNDFPKNHEGGYIKLLFHPETKQAIRNGHDLNNLNGQRPILRTYTVRRFDEKNLKMEVDFVLHGSGAQAGIASTWASQCNVGDTILIGGPGPATIVTTQTDRVLLVGDMTALPAIEVNLDQLPNNTQGEAVIQVNSTADIVSLVKPEGVEVRWLLAHENLAQYVQSMGWPKGTVGVWAACEFSTMRELRQYFKVERGVPKEHIYISSYWKQGLNEEGHKEVKLKDAQSEAA
ncbi:siderophore-interacting protein [Reinekea marina]|uniref:Siderophore-interacting protein n=2 Tax=Reinekea marina TaxID=1310421 RepID=A0ABV7WPG2_9GAMM